MKSIKMTSIGKFKIISILIIFLLCFNILFVLYPLSLLSTIKSPETNLELKILGVNSTNAHINSTFFLNNPNDFSINLKNIKIDTILPNGQSIAYLAIPTQELPPKKAVEFSETFNVCFHGQQPQTLHTEATGEIGVQIGFLQTNLPITIHVNTDMMNLINDVQAPIIHSFIQYDEINKNDLNISVQLTAYNPNTFDLDITNISIIMTTNTGVQMGSISTEDVVLPAKTNYQMNGSGSMLLTALNAQYLFVNISMSIHVEIAGFNKKLPMHITSQIELPDLNTILTPSFPTDVIIRGDYYPSLNGLIDDITFEVRNPNNIEYTMKDIRVTIYRIDKDKKTLIGNGTIENGIIKANTSTKLSGEVLIPYKKFLLPPLGARILPDWLEVDIRGNATVKGLQNYMWVGMIGYQDFHPLRKETNRITLERVWYD